MPKRENFTADRIAGLKCEQGSQQSIYWDGKTPGLGLRVTAAGVKSYVFEARLHGKTLRMTLGSPDTWPLETQWRKDKETGEWVEYRRGAREEAQRLKGIVNRGLDPRLEKEAAIAKSQEAQAQIKRRTLLLAEAWPVYLAARKAAWSERHYRDHLSLASPGGKQRKRGDGVTTAGPLAVLMPLPVSELTPERLAKWLTIESVTRPTSAAQSFRLLQVFSNWAEHVPEFRGLVPQGAFNAQSVRDALPVSHAKDGDSLQREQLELWFGAVRKLSNPVMSSYLQALLITGARREEMAGLRWEDVDFKWRSITVRDKVEGTRTIPLTPYLASLFLNLKRINDTPPTAQRIRKRIDDTAPKAPWKPSPWVFFSKTSAGGRITEPRIAHNEALAAAGLPHVTLHGLRRSFGTLCEWVEVPTGISAQIMGHAPSALAEKHYRRRPIDLLRSWHDKIESWLLVEGKIEFVAEVKGLHSVAGNPERIEPAKLGGKVMANR